VVLAVGVVLLVTAAATLAEVHADPLAPLLLLGAATVLALLSVLGSGVRLRSSAEALAAAAAALGLAAALADGRWSAGEPVTSLVLTAAYGALRLVAPHVATWPVAAWAAGQLAALRLLDELPAAVHQEGYLIVALLGLGIALWARPLVARIVLLSTAPWWLAGVVGGSADAWTGTPAGRWPVALLVTAAGAAVVLARLRRELDPWLGPPRLVPVVAGLAAGTALAGALSPLGTEVLVGGAWAGVAVPSTAAGVLAGWRRGLLLPVAVTGGTTAAVLCAGQLARDGDWGSLSVLLLLVAAPPAVTALVRRSTRPVTLPVSIWCLAGSVLLALRADVLGTTAAALLLTAVYSAAMALGSGPTPDVRRPTSRAAGLPGAAAIALPAVAGDQRVLLLVLAVQALATLGWARRAGRVSDTDPATAEPQDPVATEISAGWRVGAAHVAVGGWVGVSLADLTFLEAWTYPLAVGLLVAAGPRLLRAPSWPSWGPGLLVALAPSTAWAVVEPDGSRALWALALAVLVLVGGGVAGMAAPLSVGAGAAVVLVLGLAVPALPWPLTAALVAGAGLLALGTLREWRPVAGFRLLLAELR
jgi:hypothetical protein